MEAKDTGRVAYLDELKGLSIILVVLGHIVNYNGDNRDVYNVIYSFHMPLFVFISGCTGVISFRRGQNSGIVYLKRRFVNIMIPYFCWSFTLPLFSKTPFGEIDWAGIAKATFVTNRRFWYLPVLFGLLAGLCLYYKLCGAVSVKLQKPGADKRGGAHGGTTKGGMPKWITDIFCCCVVVAGFVLLMLITHYQLFRDIVGYTIPFFAAVFYMEYENVRTAVFKWPALVGAVLTFGVFIHRFDFDQASITTSLLRMVLGLSMTEILLWVFAKRPIPEWLGKQLRLLGKNTLLVYIIHGTMIDWSQALTVYFDHKMLSLLWTVSVSIVICYAGCLVSVAIRKIPVLKTLYLGSYR